MAATNEREVLDRLARSASKSTHHPPEGERVLRQEIEYLHQAFERLPISGRRQASLNALRKWKTLSRELQGKYVGLLSGLWMLPLHTQQPHKILRTAHFLARTANRFESTAIRAESYQALGMWGLSHGQFKQAIEALELSRALFATTGENSIDDARVTVLLSSAHRLSGDHRSALALLQRARQHCLEEEHASLLASVCLNLGLLYIESADLTAARTAFEFVIESSRILDSKKRLLRGTLGLVIAKIRSGDLEPARNDCLQALDLADYLQLPRELALAHEYLGEIATSQRDWPLAIRHYSLAAKFATRSKAAPDIRVELHRQLGQMWLNFGDDHYARIHVRKGLSLSGTGAIAEDLLALRRTSLEIAWLNDESSARRELELHFETSQRNGFGYESLLTAYRMSVIAQSLQLHEVAAHWWLRVTVLAEAVGAANLPRLWRGDQINISAQPDLRSVSIQGPSCPPSVSSQDALTLEDLPQIDLIAHSIVTNSRVLSEQASWIARVAPTSLPVLIHGDSGTGKELFASLVHDLSDRVTCPFYAINCAALPTELLESELFGHRRGAFTGAISDKTGLFRAAHRGTLFLDEIGEMSPIAQAKLLRVIETGEMRRVGDTQTEKVDVRIVAATNVNLEEAVEQKEFRRDLYYRLKGLEIHLPPLRERLEDVPLLAQHFASKACVEMGKSLELTFESTQWLLGQAWPGNVRELRLTVERAVALAPRSGLLQPHHFLAGPGARKRQSLSTELEEVERARLINALEVSDWNKTKAAKLLGMSRTTMTGRIKRLDIKRPLND